VTVKGSNDKRPDIVLYVNDIMLTVMEIKRAIVDVTEGIRQNIDNQNVEYIQHFFTTVQLVSGWQRYQGPLLRHHREAV
jgi:type I restriction enzyme, R subunit